MPVIGERKPWPDGDYSTWDGEKWVLSTINVYGVIPEDGADGNQAGNRNQGGDGEAASVQNWMPGAFGKASLVPGSINFNPCQWLYENTGIKCWWIIAAGAAYLAVRALSSRRR